MKRALLIAVVAVFFAAAAYADSSKEILAFGAMYGVDGPFINNNSIRGVLGDELPWTVAMVKGSLTTDGRVKIHVKGLVFGNDSEVPPELRGINDESQFRALVSCLVENETSIGTVNVTTGGFPASRSGDSDIDTKITLPPQCVAPIIFIMSGSEDKWFAVTGAEPGD